MNANKSVLVTGASGYIGRHVVAKLAELGVNVVAVDVADRGIPNPADIRIGDIFANSEFTDSLPVCDALLHLAWQDGFVHNAPSHLANLPRHFEFVKTMSDRGVRQIAVMGTMHEIGYWEGAIDENTPCNPMSMYGIAKNALRQALSVEFRNKPIVFQWLRGFYIYGDDRFNHSVFTKILEAEAAGKETFPFTSGRNKYDFLHVEDLAARITATVLQTEVAGIVNCCSGKPLSLAEAVEEFIKSNRLKIRLQYGAFPDRPYDSPGVWGNAFKIEKIINGAYHV